MQIETDRRPPLARRLLWQAAALPLVLLTSAGVPGTASDSTSRKPVAALPSAPWPAAFTNALPERFEVRAYAVKGDPLLTKSAFTSVLDHRAATNASWADIVQAASDLQCRYRCGGYTNVTITVGREQITNGLVTMHAFRGTIPQLVVDGRRVVTAKAQAPAATNPPPPGRSVASAPGSKRRASTNAAPAFLVRAYEIRGDTLLSTKTLTDILEKHTGTNITVPEIIQAGTELQMEYRKRGYPTVKVTIPPQKLDSNAMVKIRVFEGRLAEINVLNNRYFSSNNIMRALPSLHTNMILVEPVFQAELDRANANRDRQIYPEIGPGPAEGATTLDLKVKDRLPLHAKVEFDNQNSPGTPDLRLNTSAVYNNLWQLEHSLGVQYGFSPLDFKSGNQWSFYDQPLVANYGGFYRLPLGSPSPIAAAIAESPGSFGYDEATRKFRLPPPSGQAELNLFASRSTIDTGLMTLMNTTLFNTNGNKLDRQDVQQDLTVNEDLGARLNLPLAVAGPFLSGVVGGLDYKSYALTSTKTNVFTLNSVVLDTLSGSALPVTNINTSTIVSPVPTTWRSLDYLPLSLHYNAGLRDALGTTSFGLGLSVNGWYSGSRSNLQSITGSTDSSGHWVILNPTVSRDFTLYPGWTLSLNAGGQWADEPLISNEQFGLGGVNTVRGYHEGEVFGSSGWFFTAEQRTPPYVVGRVYGHNALSVRGSVYMGYGQAFALGSHQDLWGAGFGAAASIGPWWEARFLFSWPLIDTTFTESGQPRFDFALSAQF